MNHYNASHYNFYTHQWVQVKAGGEEPVIGSVAYFECSKCGMGRHFYHMPSGFIPLDTGFSQSCGEFIMRQALK